MPMPIARFALTFLVALLMLSHWAAAQSGRGGNQFAAGVYKSQIAPHWLAGNTRFWYRNDLRAGAKEFILVDASAGTRKPAFDHQRLAAALSRATGKEFSPDHLPFTSIDFLDDSKSIRFQTGGVAYKCDLDS